MFARCACSKVVFNKCYFAAPRATTRSIQFCLEAHPHIVKLLYPPDSHKFITKDSRMEIGLRWSNINDWGWPCTNTYQRGLRKYVLKFNTATEDFPLDTSETATIPVNQRKFKVDSDGTITHKYVIPSLSVGTQTFTWSVHSQNEQKFHPNRFTYTFAICRTSPPAQPALSTFDPSDISYVDELVFSWSHSSWGEVCGSDLSNFKYRLHVRVENTASDLITRESLFITFACCLVLTILFFLSSFCHRPDHRHYV